MDWKRETNTFIYDFGKDLSGFTDGTGNPDARQDVNVAIVKDKFKPEKGAGGSFIIAQRWVHDLEKFTSNPVHEQEKVIGRTKEADKMIYEGSVINSHVSKTNLKRGTDDTASTQVGKRGEMTRRSTPYAFHDKTVGL